MKLTKKLIALALALVLVLAMTATTFAANDNGQITITGATVDQKYELYRVFDLTGADPDATTGLFQSVSYTVAPKWEGFFAAGAPGETYLKAALETGKNWSSVTVGGVTKYIAIESGNVSDFALAALSWIKNVAADATETATSDTVVISGLPLGYYLVYPVGATENIGNYTSIASLTNTMPTATVATKATPPSINKTAQDHHVEVGQSVPYEVTSKVPNTTGYDYYEFTMGDSVTKGLTFTEAIANLTLTIDGQAVAFNQADGNNNGKAKVTAVTWTAADYSDADPANHKKAGFTFTIDMTEFQSSVGKEVKLTYNAKVNAEAIVSGGENLATLDYNNDPSDLTKKGHDDDDDKVHTSKIVIDKYDANDTTKKLAGAEFVLYKVDNTDPAAPVNLYYQWDATNEEVKWVTDKNSATKKETGTSGEAEFGGLAEGTYYLEETKSPAGYNLLPDPEEVVITEDDTSVSTTVSVTAGVANNSGTELPGTGGIGTKIFYVLGAALALGAVVVLITRRRAGEEA